VEEEAMECVFQNRPNDVSGKEACHSGSKGELRGFRQSGRRPG
jgi:hypothetical protein